MIIPLFALSAVTALLCCLLLLRGYLRNKLRLLFWSGICFFALALENVVLILNEYVPADLTVVRLTIPLIGLVALLYGLLWEADGR